MQLTMYQKKCIPGPKKKVPKKRKRRGRRSHRKYQPKDSSNTNDVQQKEEVYKHITIPSNITRPINSIDYVEFYKDPNDPIRLDDHLCSIYYKDETKIDIISEYDGKIISTHNPKANLKENSKNLLFKVTGCNHPEICFGICTICSQQVSETLGKKPNMVNFIHGDLNIRINDQEAMKIDSEHQHNLITKEKKLILILDLDHTLVHTTNSSSVKHWYDRMNEEERVKNQIYSFKCKTSVHYVKLRKNIFLFLEKIRNLYELHIWTLGTKSYSREIQKIIDPTKEIFHNRIVSREECPTINSKTLKNKFPHSVNKVLIIDDTEIVWKDYSDHLIHIDAFRFFIGGNEVNNEAGKNNLVVNGNGGGGKNNNVDNGIEEFCRRLDMNLAKKDVQFEIIQRVLTNVHEEFFKNYQGEEEGKKKMLNVADLLNIEKAKVFKGCKFTFSRLIALGKPSKQSIFWKKSMEFGAKCYEKFNENLTHVIANSRYVSQSSEFAVTEKIRLSRKSGKVFIVNEKWLSDSIKYFSKQNEYDYMVYPNVQTPVSENFDDPREVEMIQKFQKESKFMMDMIQEKNLKIDKIIEDYEEEEKERDNKSSSKNNELLLTNSFFDDILKEIGEDEGNNVNGDDVEKGSQDNFDSVLEEMLNDDLGDLF